MSFEDRGYQTDAGNAFFQAIRDGHRRVILCSPTGSGKSVMAMRLCEHLLKHGKKINFNVDRTVLVDQISAEFDRFRLPHGVEAGANTFFTAERLMVRSVQTMRSRDINPNDADLNIVDEAHIGSELLAEARRRGNGVWLGLTASPVTKASAVEWDTVINVISTDELIDAGHLAPVRIYSGVPMEAQKRTSAGEYDLAAAATEAMRIVGKILENWEEKTEQSFGGPVKTIAFSNTVEDGKKIAQTFRDAGYEFQAVSYLNDDDEKRELVQALKKGEIMGLVSCEMLQRGFDVKDILCGISAHTWRAKAPVIQEPGRVMRAAPGKDFALWMDHSQNILRHRDWLFPFWAQGVDDLPRGPSIHGKDAPDRKDAYCPECEAMLTGPRCKVCGWTKPRPVAGGRAIGGARYVDGELVPLGDHSGHRPITVRVGRKEYELPKPAAGWSGLCYIAREKGKDAKAAQKWCQANYLKFYGDFAHRRYREDAEYPPPASQLRHAVEHSTRLYIEKQKRLSTSAPMRHEREREATRLSRLPPETERRPPP